MNKKKRARSGVIFNVMFSISWIVIGLMVAAYSSQAAGLVFVITGILMLLSTPLSIRWSKRQADLNEMLEEYRKNKPNK